MGGVHSHGEFDTHMSNRSQTVKTAGHLPGELVRMDGRTGLREMAKSQTLLKLTRNKKLWRTMIVHAQGTQ